MAWKKIDDYNGSTYVDFQPYSAFVAQGLTNNARSYPYELTRGTTRSFRRGLTAPKFAAYGEPSGTVIWVNCGSNATTVSFKITYASATAHTSAGRMGRWVVYHLASNGMRSVDASASTGGTTVTINFSPNTNPLNGFQSFFIGFQSEVLNNLGSVDVYWVDNNNVGLDSNGGYTVTTGEKWEVLILNPASPALQAARFNSTAWQIGYLDHRPGNASVAVVFPGDVVYPDQASTNPSNKSMFGNVYELGAVTIADIAYEVTEANPNALVDQFNHYDAIALTGVNSAQSSTIRAYLPEISAGQSEPYHLGRYLDVVPDAITATFAVQADTTASIEVILSCVYVVRVAGGTASETITLDILDETGASVLVAPVSQTFTVRRYSPTPSAFGDAYTFRALAGILAAPNQWGLRDAVPLSDIKKGETLSLSTPPVYLNSLDNGGVYTLKLTGGGIYVFGFSARMV
jgi:hypothetical protein